MQSLRNTPQSPPQQEPLVDAIEAGAFLRLRPRRVLELARHGTIPAYPVASGKRRVFAGKIFSYLGLQPIKQESGRDG
jgi:hypothetical protein